MRTIYLNRYTTNFTTLPNAMLRDKSLSFRARGILAMVLTNSAEWEVTQTWLKDQGTEGREAISASFKELESAGYVVYEQRNGEGGKFEAAVWAFYGEPVPERLRSNKTNWNKPTHGKPSHGKTTSGEPATKKEHIPEVLSEETVGDPPSPEVKHDGIADDVNAVVEAWNATEGLPRCLAVNDKRKRTLKVRLNDPFFAANWRTALAKIPKSKFMMGDNRQGWRATFDWFLQSDVVVKIMEGKYDNHDKGSVAVNDPRAEDWMRDING